ncbi:methyltransferase domain-containing protein [Nonomuraea roseoviolacea]|uniref:Ubiquinone/menaquinone biosynthesis C-methylase UbiE n=1 Tax=Nonomuraea roseoviolacea subsp. carminata TaxID=160689 RepID=A0ABT1K008_9ACTN|nr:methyltransferase domain-containing protein [Nonomuraea roseoviolacea]MCP2347342.1 ubiquinone/menaquinone biosynthesis C-methylase UbiE [Nonomuraea roseoviolacea subsp. carminata]
MPNTSELVALLDAADTLPGATALRERSYELLRLAPGTPAVDVGCGTGRAVAELRERGAGPIGVDLSADMIGIARDRWPGADFRVGDAYDLPLGDGEVAAYRADKVFHELGDAGRALREAVRVLAPGGRIALAGQDWDAIVVDSGHPLVTRTIVHARADQLPDPRAARRYRDLLLTAGFTEVHVEVHTAVLTDATLLPMVTNQARGALAAGAITQDEHDAWLADQHDRARRGRLLLAVPMFLATATRP